MAFKVDPQKLLEKQARKFVPYWKEYGIEDSNKVTFSAEQKKISLRFCERKSLLNRTHMLVVRVGWYKPGFALSDEGNCCSINRMGRWRMKKKDPFLSRLKDTLNKLSDFAIMVKKLDYENISFSHDGTSLSLEILPYGGGFVSMVLPPLQFEVGISEGQILLLKDFIQLIDSVAYPSR